MTTAIDCQNDVSSGLTELSLGKQHLLDALESGNEQTFLLALYDIMDAILEELERD